ncbi:hypothetical protein [Salsuginibacillus halophilus]|nr:hypothetical protein [Salsuginibacillus halophilus]
MATKQAVKNKKKRKALRDLLRKNLKDLHRMPQPKQSFCRFQLHKKQ